MIEMDERRKEFYRIALTRSSTPHIPGSMLPIPQRKLEIDMYKPQLEMMKDGPVGHEFVTRIYMDENATGMNVAINTFALNHLFYAAYARNLIAYREKYGNDQSTVSMVTWMLDSVIRFNETCQEIGKQVGVKFKPLNFNVELLKYTLTEPPIVIPIPIFDQIEETFTVQYLPYKYITFNKSTLSTNELLFSYTLSFTRSPERAVISVLSDELADRSRAYTNLLHISFDNISGKPPMGDLVEEFLDTVVKDDGG